MDTQTQDNSDETNDKIGQVGPFFPCSNFSDSAK
jgi:hypothetical protein